jgi:hypothetical protein
MIIGRQKCGTTSLASWLADQPEVFFCQPKEPHFFARDASWRRGVEWYASLYESAAEGQLLGEGSQSYTHPDLNVAAADRIAQTIPSARLIYMIRHPVERIRSHYRHMRIWGDETGSLADVLRRPDSEPIRHNMYYECLAPYTERFPRDQILVVRMEDLVDAAGSGWTAVLEHLGLPKRPRPDTARNVSSGRALYRAPMRFFRSIDYERRLAWVPRPIRMVAKRLTRSRGPRFERMLEESQAQFPSGVLDPVWDDITRLENWVGRSQPFWPREPDREADQTVTQW